ncbi:hypothetical protein OMW55_05825 [Sphingomonas sp. BN140010]|uniref:DUF1328 domain-containing protein n=1 Tax=Sphingomonas arvum TaxID=2992113 RepID=A0ABT3JE87_9SPHN|nr:hypothetical protein [Sphingomonas sp. BN140010]MCW3797324.1 hypothetical protein [Sphingomonas sp. BN140010]
MVLALIVAAILAFLAFRFIAGALKFGVIALIVLILVLVFFGGVH